MVLWDEKTGIDEVKSGDSPTRSKSESPKPNSGGSDRGMGRALALCLRHYT